MWGQAPHATSLFKKGEAGKISGGARAWLDLALEEQCVTPQGFAGSPSSQLS